MGTSNLFKFKSVAVVIPAYQECKMIGGIVERLKKLGCVSEVIVVDDGSTDQTGEAAAAAGATVLRHPYNKGNGSAIKTGIRYANADVIVLMDGDGQHTPEELPGLLESIKEYDMVVGSRDAVGQASVLRLWANSIYNRLASYATQFDVEDLTSGFRCIRTNVLKNYLYLLPNSFSYPSTLTLALLRSGHSLKYLPISVQKRQGKSKIKLFRDGIRFLIIILKITMLFSPIRIFLPVSGAIFLLGLSNYAYTFLTYHRFTNMSALLMATSVLIFMMGLIAEQISMLRMEHSEG